MNTKEITLVNSEHLVVHVAAFLVIKLSNMVQKRKWFLQIPQNTQQWQHLERKSLMAFLEDICVQGKSASSQIIIHGPESGNPYNIVDIDEWNGKRNEKESGEYISMSYTREQHHTFTKEETWNLRDPPKPRREIKTCIQRPKLRDGDLYQIGTLAAPKADVSHFGLMFYA